MPPAARCAETKESKNKVCIKDPIVKKSFNTIKYVFRSVFIQFPPLWITFRTERCVTYIIYIFKIFFFYFLDFFSLKKIKIFNWKKLQKFSKFLINLWIFHEITEISVKNTPVKTIKRINFVKKIINFDIQQKISPRGSPPYRESP